MIDEGSAVTLARGLQSVPVGIVIDSRTKSVLRRKKTQYKVRWGQSNGSVAPPEWVDEDSLATVPHVDEPSLLSRTFPEVVIEDIASAFERGEFDDAEASGEGLARAIRERYLEP